MTPNDTQPRVNIFPVSFPRLSCPQNTLKPDPRQPEKRGKLNKKKNIKKRGEKLTQKITQMPLLLMIINDKIT